MSEAIVAASAQSAEAGQAEKEQLYKLRHSAAHIMAEAVLGIYPDAKIAIGPPIDTGFYYDFDLGKDEAGKPRTFSPEEYWRRLRSVCAEIIAGKFPLQYRKSARMKTARSLPISPQA